VFLEKKKKKKKRGPRALWKGESYIFRHDLDDGDVENFPGKDFDASIKVFGTGLHQ